MKTPSWITALLDRVLDLVECSGSMSSMLSPPCEEHDRHFWVIFIHPALGEIRGASAHDGEEYYGQFRVDLMDVYRTLTDVEYMTTSNGCNSCGSPPQINILGYFRGNKVGICIQSSPPLEAPVQEYTDANTGEVSPAQ